jgi:hypothetical protein
MNKSPRVYGLTLCDRVRVERNPPSFNLDGIFLAREFAAFPTQACNFDIYACLFDGRGEGVIDLTCTQLEGEQDIYYHRGWLAFPHSVPTVHYVRSVKGLRFRKAGRYAFTLSFDKTPLTVRYLDVKGSHR